RLARRRLGRRRVQTAQDRQPIAKRLEGLPDERQLIRQSAFLLGDPVPRSGAVRDEAAKKATRRHRSRLREGSRCGNHRIKQGKSKRDARTSQQRTSRYVLLSYKHGYSLPTLSTLHVHRERRALDDSHQQRRESIVILGGIAGNRADERHVLVLDSAAQGIGQ